MQDSTEGTWAVIRLILRVDQRVSGLLELSSRLGRNLYSAFNITVRHCFLAKRISSNSCLWKGRNKNFWVFLRSHPCEYVRKSQPSPLRPALLLIEKEKRELASVGAV